MILFHFLLITGATAVGIGLAVVLFLIAAVIAFVAFKTLKKTVKMAVRMAIVAVILLVAFIGAIGLILFSVTPSKPDRPPVKTTK